MYKPLVVWFSSKPAGARGEGSAVACTEGLEWSIKAIGDGMNWRRTKSLELRAGIGLNRLWQQQGKQAGALSLLTEVYNGFTEGCGTTDLQEAKVMLHQLTS
jgi:hypothetical protein